MLFRFRSFLRAFLCPVWQKSCRLKTQREFRQTPHYLETMRPLGVQHQIVVTVDIPGHMAGVTVNRGRDFTNRESAFLGLLAPHLAAATVKLRKLNDLQKTLDSIPFPTPDQLQRVGFTPRESEILFWVMQGKRDSEIAEILSEKREVSLRTINNHVRNILVKMNAETRTGACMNALERIKKKVFNRP
jgi:DNA-binding CsgD family transcriptional regulator